MILRELYVQNYRNYTEGRAEFCDGVNVLLGENAQGKTNLLEAVSLLSGRKSFRAQRERDLIRSGADRAGVQGRVLRSDGETDVLRLELSALGRRQLFRNGVKKTRLSDLTESLRTVLFLPEDLRIIEDGASARRRFLDGALCQLSPRYARLLRDYQKVLDQKSKVLRDYAEAPAYVALLPAYDDQLSRLGAGLVSLRARFLRRLGELSAELHGQISGGRDALELRYETVSCLEDPFLPEPELYALLNRHYDRRREAELAAGTCLSGPHRDDFQVLIGGAAARYFGSKGQIRTAAISLKLSERQLQYETFGEYPLLLLDDVLSELDDRRRDFVVNQIDRGQVLLTCCRPEQLHTGRIFTIHGGAVTGTEELK